MAEVPGNEEEEAAATSEVEDIPGRRAVQAKVLDFDDVPFQPAGNVDILGVVERRRGVTLLDLAQLNLINAGENRFRRNRREATSERPPAAPVSFSGREFGNLMGKLQGQGGVINKFERFLLLIM